MSGSVLDQIADVLKCGKGKGCDHGSIFDLLRFRLKYQQIKEQWQKFHHFLHHRGDLGGGIDGVRLIKPGEEGVEVGREQTGPHPREAEHHCGALPPF